MKTTICRFPLAVNYCEILKSIVLKFIIGALVMFPTSSYAWAEALVYQIRLTPHQTQGQVTVDTSALSDFELVPARSMPQDKKIAPLIFCDGEKIARANKPLLLNCKQISWELTFKNLLLEDENASHQSNLFIDQPKPWWLLTEWDNLPRITNQELQAQVCAEVNGAPALQVYCKPLPTRQQAPLIMGIGHPQSSYKSGNLEVNLFGKVDRNKAHDLLKQYNKINDYLSAVMPSKKNKIPWDLIWLPVEKSSGSLGGAAGHHSFVANYPVENGEWIEQSTMWLLKISAHETVHALSRLNNPLWADESLAEYYAFKAIAKLGLAEESPLADWELRSAKIPHANRGLYYAEEQITEHKDMSFYPLLYVKGAAFWYEIDIKLQSQGENLDEYIKMLDGLTYHKGYLPKQFELILKTALTPSVWAEIKNKYLLDQ